MSSILRGIKSLPGTIAATPGTLLRGACALPGAIKNTTVWAVSSAASFSLRKATSLKDTTVQFAKSAGTGLKNVTVNTTYAAVGGGWGLTKYAAGQLQRGTVYLLNAGKEAAVAKSVHNYAELFFRIQNVADKLWNDLSGKVPLSQFNRNDLAQRLDAFLQLKTLKADDNAFVARLCADLRDPSVIFDKRKEPEMQRLAKILPPDFIIPVSQANRNELAERLEEFNELYSLKADDKTFIAALCADLRNVSVIFDKSKESEMERLEQILSPYLTQHQSYILSKRAERVKLENVPYLSTSAPPKLTPEQTLDGIKDQVDLLKSNAINLVLGSVILNMTLGLYTCDQIDIEAFKKALNGDFEFPPTDGKNTNLVNFLIEIVNKAEVEGMSSEELFKKLVYRAIDASGHGLLARIHAKFRCLYTSGLISNLVGNLLDNLKDTLVHFAKLPPAKQLEEITALLIDPLLKYLTDIENGQTPQTATTTPAAPMNKFWAALFKYNKPGPKNPAELLDLFIEVFLAQFLDKKYQPLTRTYRTKCIEKAYRSNIIVKPLFLTLAGLLWIVGKIIAPLQWTLNETIHFLLRTIIVGLCPGLANSTKDSLEIGKPHAWYSLKNNLLLMLQQTRLTALLPRAEDLPFQPPKQIPAEVTAKLNTLLDKLFSQLGDQNPVQNATAAPGAQAPVQASQPPSTSNAVFEFLLSSVEAGTMELLGDPEEAKRIRAEDANQQIGVAQQNLNGGNLGWLKNIIKTSVTELALDMCAQEGFISESLLASLTSTNASGFAATTALVADTEKQRIDTELNQELGLLGPAILKSVNDATRTDIMYQTEANVFINSLQQEAENFQRELLQLHKNPDLSFRKDSLTICSKFLETMGRLRTKLVATVDEPTQALLMPHFGEALLHVTNMASYLTQAEVEKTRKQVEAKFDELYSYLEMPLDNEEEIDATLMELRALNPTFVNLEAFEEALKNRIKLYTERLQSPKAREQHPRAAAKPLLMLIADYKDRANREAHTQIKKFKPLEADLRSKLAEFDAWGKKLKFVKVKAKPGVKDAAMAHLYASPMVSAIASAGIQAYGRNFFTFIGDENNLAGIAQRGMEAYLNKPAMMPKKERVSDNFFSWGTRNNPRQLTEIEEAKLRTRGWVSLTYG